MIAAAVFITGCTVVAPTIGTGCGSTGAACSHGPTAAPGGLSQVDAVAKARALAPGISSSTSVQWAAIESDPFGPHGTTPPGPLVWEVRLQGDIAESPCPAGFLAHIPTSTDPPCLDSDSGVIAVLDYFTGKLLGWLH